MADSFRRDLVRILEDNRCRYVRTGRHPMYYSPITKINFPVQNVIKSAHTANGVLKQAGLPKAF